MVHFAEDVSRLIIERTNEERHGVLQLFTETTDEAFHSIEQSLVTNHLVMNARADDAFAILKAELSNLKDRL